MYKKVSNILIYHLPIHIIMMVTALLPDCEPVNKLRGILLKPFFKQCGRNLQVASNVYFTHINNIDLGENVYIARNCWIGGYGGILVDDNVMIGPGVVIASSNHSYSNGSIRYGSNEKKEISIGKEVWVGANSTILPGVKLNNNIIVGAGSVVCKNIDESICLIAGSPARYIKKIENKKNINFEISI
ncbi:acyltransferase [Paraclostridium sordellii]|uniref:acyltransferase n=1 Tax=Paraclostridium sordellii TaxID=1505 RepID=UPI0022E2219E|nr:DapH/DapD/GlmU-related protein [Paeniclostridium sordellii]